MHKKNYLSIVAILVLVLALGVITFKVIAATSPSLGAAASYSVISHTNATNTGSTTVCGNIGDETGAPADVGTLTVGPPGVINPVTPSVGDAQLANTAVFNGTGSTGIDQTCTVSYPEDPHELSGSTLVPGVYCANSFSLTGTLTLSGGAGEVYIFKSASTLVTSGTANVVGGDPCNVWWRVVSSATLGTYTSLIGNILASTSISLQTGAVLNGLAFAQTGAVTMDSNTICGPVCVIAPTRRPPAPTAVGLPNTGGAPIQNNSFPWSLVILGGLGAIALTLGVIAYRRDHLTKK
jgi:type VI secretion system secreted protein VgrG